MRLRPEQLAGHLGKGLAPIYLVSGDEPLLMQETADTIRHAAGARGYAERQCLTVTTGFDWNTLLQASASLSLFSARRLLELRLDGAKPGDAGGKALRAYAERPAEEIVLLILCNKLDRAAQKSRWFTALESAGVVVQVWPVESRQLPVWIERRMRQKKLQPDAEVVALLAARVEGNLLAAAQEIDKLYLLFGAGGVSVAQLLAVVGDSARYSIYDLVDAALAGNHQRVVKIARGLRSEGVEPILVLWALHREIGLLARLNAALRRGVSLESAFNQHKVWDKRKPLLRHAVQRLPADVCWHLLQDCAVLDRMIKGVEPGEPWEGLLLLSVHLAGRELLPLI